MFKSDEKQSIPVWSPRTWPTLLALGLLRLVSLLPYPVLCGIGWLLGNLLRLVWKRRKVVDVNLKLCFPELSDKERARIARDHFGSLVTGFFDLAITMWASDRNSRTALSAL